MILTNKSDNLGIVISSLCFLHCLATPFLFIAQTCSKTCCDEAPVWWRSIDIIFLGVSFFAILISFRKSDNNWIKILLWANWLFLSFVIFFEELFIDLTFDHIILVPAISLIILHYYNKKFCIKGNNNSNNCSADCCS